MNKKDDMPPEGTRIFTAALSQVRPAEKGMLRDLEFDWPGSRALLACLAIALNGQDPEALHEVLRQCLIGGLDAYRASREARDGDQRRFAAFVAGLTETLAEPDQRALLTAPSSSSRAWSRPATESPFQTTRTSNAPAHSRHLQSCPCGPRLPAAWRLSGRRFTRLLSG
jgi:hypothetical protein